MGELDHSVSRDPALDFTKGVLVLCMVLYHWLNYFVGIEGPMYPYLRFVPPSFIFISGFVLASVYPRKYGLNNSKLYIRLLVRGLKILALFTLLNIGVNIVLAKSYRDGMSGVEALVNDVVPMYIAGNGSTAFGILVPISYLLIFSTLIFLSMQVTQYALLIICVTCFVGIVLLEYFGMSIQYLSLLAIGILGMLLGQYPLCLISDLASRSCVLAGLYGGYLVALNIWGERYSLEVIGVCLSVLFIYGVGVRSTPGGPIVSILVLLGKYSLLSYVAQIGLLQLLQRSLAMVNINHLELWALSFIAAFALTIITVWGVHRICSQWPIVNRMYRTVFT